MSETTSLLRSNAPVVDDGNLKDTRQSSKAAHEGSPYGAAARNVLGVGKTAATVDHSAGGLDDLPPGVNVFALPRKMRKRRGWASRLCCCRLTRGSFCFRFSLLFLSSLMVLNGYFSFDLPSITSDDLKRLLDIDNAQYGLLFSGKMALLGRACDGPAAMSERLRNALSRRHHPRRSVRIAKCHPPYAIWHVLRRSCAYKT